MSNLSNIDFKNLSRDDLIAILKCNKEDILEIMSLANAKRENNFVTYSKNLAQKHYAEHEGKPFYPRLISYITSGPIVAMVVEGVNVIAESRKMMGKTKPEEAEVGTIRFDYALSQEFNIVHGSDSVASAEREIAIYFKEEEICSDWKTMLEMLMSNG